MSQGARAWAVSGTRSNTSVADDLLRGLFITPPPPATQAVETGSTSLPLSSAALEILAELECTCSSGDGDAHTSSCADKRYAAAQAYSEELRSERAALVRRAVGNNVAGGRHSGGVRAFYLQEAQALMRSIAAAEESASHALFCAQNARAVRVEHSESSSWEKTPTPTGVQRTVIGGPDDFPMLSRARELMGTAGRRAAAAAAAAGAATVAGAGVGSSPTRLTVDLHGQRAVEACSLLRDFILASAIAAEASEVDIITGTGSARKDGGAPMKSAVRALLAELAASPGSDVVAVFEGRSAFTVHLRPRAASAPAPAPALAPATAPLATSLKPASGKQSFGRRKGSTVSPASNNFDGGDGLDLTSAFVRGVKKPGTCAPQVPRR